MEPQTKKCTKCGQEKDATQFGKLKTGKQGRRSACNICRTAETRLYCQKNKQAVKEYHKNYRQKHLDKKQAYDREWARQNKTRKDQYKMQWEAKNKTRMKEVRKRWKSKNRIKLKEKARVYKRHRIKTDRTFAMVCRLRARLNSALRGKYKTGSAVRDLGMPVDAFLVYSNLDALDKYGIPYTGNEKLFHIDHIRPLVSFNLEDPEQLKRAVHWSNLQILLASENLAKGARTP